MPPLPAPRIYEIFFARRTFMGLQKRPLPSRGRSETAREVVSLKRALLIVAEVEPQIWNEQTFNDTDIRWKRF